MLTEETKAICKHMDKLTSELARLNKLLGAAYGERRAAAGEPAASEMTAQTLQSAT